MTTTPTGIATSRAWRLATRGKVAFAGGACPGRPPLGWRSMDRTLGAFSIACRAGDARLKPSDVDGLFQCPNNMAGATGSAAANRGRSAPTSTPLRLEDGLTVVTNKWMLANFRLTNVTFAPDGVPDIGEGIGMAAQASPRASARSRSSSTPRTAAKAATER
jgi:hypothetical protein